MPPLMRHRSLHFQDTAAAHCGCRLHMCEGTKKVHFDRCVHGEWLRINLTLSWRRPVSWASTAVAHKNIGLFVGKDFDQL